MKLKNHHERLVDLEKKADDIEAKILLLQSLENTHNLGNNTLLERHAGVLIRLSNDVDKIGDDISMLLEHFHLQIVKIPARREVMDADVLFTGHSCVDDGP